MPTDFRPADIVFLLNASASMAPRLDAVKKCIRDFYLPPQQDPDQHWGWGMDTPITNWRAKVVGFRDYKTDGPGKWRIDNPFVTDPAELKEQLDGIRAEGGAAGSNSLLDALYREMRLESSGPDESPDPGKWRHKSSVRRAIVLFTDAPYEPRMTVPEASDHDIEDILDLIMNERIYLFIFSPEDPAFELLAEVPCSEYFPNADPDTISLYGSLSFIKLERS